MRLTYYMDVHVPRAVTMELRICGIVALTAQQDGSANLNDAVLLQKASSLHRSGIPFAGIVYAHQLRITIGQLIDDLEMIAKATEPAEWNGRIDDLPRR